MRSNWHRLGNTVWQAGGLPRDEEGESHGEPDTETRDVDGGAALPVSLLWSHHIDTRLSAEPFDYLGHAGRLSN